MRHEEQRFYILVAADVHSMLRSKPSAFAVADQCLREGRWGIGSRLISSLPVGSKVLIYLAGKREFAQTFIATGEIAGAPLERKLQIDEKTWMRTIPLKAVKRFNSPIPIRPLLHELGFLSEPGQKRWGSRFQGGLLQISAKAYQVVIRASTNTPKRSVKAVAL